MSFADAQPTRSPGVRDVSYAPKWPTLLTGCLSPALPAKGRPVLSRVHGGTWVMGSKNEPVISLILHVPSGIGYACAQLSAVAKNSLAKNSLAGASCRAEAVLSGFEITSTAMGRSVIRRSHRRVGWRPSGRITRLEHRTLRKRILEPLVMRQDRPPAEVAFLTASPLA